MATLSIIVPTLNEAPGIVAHLGALQPLRARGAEVIVVDGGSTDGTPALSASLADRVLVAPRGRAAQMNAGAEVARGDVVLFLHADTRLPEDADRLIGEALARWAALWGRFDVTIESHKVALSIVGWAMNRRSRWTGIATGDQAMFVRRHAFAAVGGFPELALMEDIALCRLLKRGGGPACVTQRAITSGRRWEKQGVVRTILLMWRLRAGYWLGVDPRRLAQAYGDDTRAK